MPHPGGGGRETPDGGNRAMHILSALVLPALILLSDLPAEAATHAGDLAGNPCGELLSALPIASPDPGPYLLAADCLRRQGSPSRPADSLLKARLPGERSWYSSFLNRFRGDRDIPRALNMAYLAEAKAWDDAGIQKDLYSSYMMVPDTYRAGLALLKLAEIDTSQAFFIRAQFESLLHHTGSETPASAMLDSLTGGYRHKTAVTARMLEQAGWVNRNHTVAFRNFMAAMALGDSAPAPALERVLRFQSLGYFDHASSILDRLEWRRLPQPWKSRARERYLQIAMQLQDWIGILAETRQSAGPSKESGDSNRKSGRKTSGSGFFEEEAVIAATARLKSGQPEEALDRLRDLPGNSHTPWSFRGRLLKAQALMAMEKPEEAARTLDALKRDPQRREGTGPILFWQGCMALDQGRFAAAESLLVLASAYTGAEESQRALEYRFYMLLDTGEARPHFFRGLSESPRGNPERRRALDRVPEKSGLWPFAQLEKAQMYVKTGHTDSAAAVFDTVSKRSPDRPAAFHAEAKAAFMAEKMPGGRQAALARYGDLLIKYQQGVIPEFSRERIKALE